MIKNDETMNETQAGVDGEVPGSNGSEHGLEGSGMVSLSVMASLGLCAQEEHHFCSHAEPSSMRWPCRVNDDATNRLLAS